ncbi:MAG: UDP-3-O-(3-hydroxymyristoyl)glucosamine N-acyltransferase [Candidatus Omnitrophica bacterium]|nr:UDP-3-O-(3-hydroxymyristoyl)glucosamine N-acyltransferase [Candidatus Omnitrophota bacterium]
MKKTLGSIAKEVGGEVDGNADVSITGISGLKEAREGDITFVANSKYFSLVKETQASAIIVPLDMETTGKNVLRVENSSLVFAEVASFFVEENPYKAHGIHPTAVIADDVKLGKNVHVGPCAVIENDVEVGDNTIIASGCFVGYKTIIGTECLFHGNVTIREKSSIGNRVIIHSGTVVGSDGFGFENVDGVHYKIPQTGVVVIEDDVEIGANVTIDRARFDKTCIGKGTKIDNLVQIGHNVQIGQNCIIIAQVGISGSCQIEDNVILAGQAGLAGHLTIGAGAIVASQAGVINSVPPGIMVSGFPAKPHSHAKRVNACVQRLPQYIKTLNELKDKIEKLERKINNE